jgi:hypothetical protein
MSKGLSIIETLIVIAIFGILSIAVISILDPLEQIARGKDISLIQTSEIITNAVNRYSVSQKSLPWTTDIQTVTLDTPDGESFVANIITLGELKNNFPETHNKNFQKLYVTTQTDDAELHLCFQPHSKAYKNHPHTTFSQNGVFNPECFNNRGECFFCFGVQDLGETIGDSAGGGSGSGDDLSEMTEEEQLCSNFDPEYPEYPWTCNYSDTYAEFGCTNFCVQDHGCDGYCPDGQRHVRKNYYATNDDFAQCLSAGDQVRVDYCISDPSARCDLKSYGSRPSDYQWGCTNPRRPYKWIE